MEGLPWAVDGRRLLAQGRNALAFFSLTQNTSKAWWLKTLYGARIQSETHRLDVFKVDLLRLGIGGLSQPLTTRLALRVREAELVLLIVDLIVCFIYRR